jgi:hypothetical protein
MPVAPNIFPNKKSVTALPNRKTGRGKGKEAKRKEGRNESKVQAKE